MLPAQLLSGLDEAKLTPPAIRRASVAKSDVIGRLLASSAPFVAVVAPAGYGKTTLVAHWARADPRPFAWLSLDERDDDSVVFLRGIAAAIHRVEPISPGVFEALSGPADSIWTRVPHVGNALAALERPLVLALEDLHTIRNADCLTAVAALFDYVPPQSQIAITSREKPALPLARWRTRGMLQEVGPADLRLDHREADRLLKGAGVALQAPDIADLTDRTEGWPAGLYLSALSLRAGAPDRVRVRVEAFSGNDPYVSDYFRLEVLSRLPDEEAQFMTRTSVLDSLNGPLCDFVLERGGSAHLLELLERSNRFVVPLDRQSESYRYHHLFRQLLRNELQRSEPDAVATLNRRAMAWYRQEGDLETAVRYGRAAGERAAVAGMVEELVLPLYYDGRVETAEEGINWFRDDELAQFPGLAVYAGWVRILTGRSGEAERFLAIAQSATGSLPIGEGRRVMEGWVATLRATMMPDGIERALADADFALEGPPAALWGPSALLMRGVAHVAGGSTDCAEADFLEGLAIARASAGRDITFVLLGELALLEANQGAWSDAARYAQEAQALMRQMGLDQYVASAIVHVASARVAMHELRYPEARSAMTSAHRLRPLLDVGLRWLAVQVGTELARAHLALREVDSARSLLREVARVIDSGPDLGRLADGVRELNERVLATSKQDGGRSVALTAAELRLLPYLATHLTFPEIGTRLFISSETVKSEAKAIYRKLDASTRGDAIERAVEIGLLEPMFTHRASAAR